MFHQIELSHIIPLDTDVIPSNVINEVGMLFLLLLFSLVSWVFCLLLLSIEFIIFGLKYTENTDRLPG